MSNEIDEIFIDSPKPIKTKSFDDWKSYAVHDEKNIKGFFGDYRFLSNFFVASVYFEGLLYSSSEHAYQAAKIVPEQREPFLYCSSSDSKKLWKKPEFEKLYKAEEWDSFKHEIMSKIVFEKFHRNVDLRQKLLSTYPKFLEEKNAWHDTFWGTDSKTGKGQNNLGKILMATRTYWWFLKGLNE